MYDHEKKDTFLLEPDTVANPKQVAEKFQLPELSSLSARSVIDKPKILSLEFTIPLLPQKVSVDLTGMMSKLLAFAELSPNQKKGPEIFSILNVSNPDQPIEIREEHVSLSTNLPFVAFHLKVGRSDRIYLFYTLANELYRSYKTASFSVFNKIYFPLFSDKSQQVVADLEVGPGVYDHTAFIHDANNQVYIDSITILPVFQRRLSEITGITELGYVHPNYLIFQEYQHSDLLQFWFSAPELEPFRLPISVGRVDYKAHTHIGVKPLFCSNSIIPYMDKLKEIYWLNTNNYHSSGEMLMPEEDVNSIPIFSDKNSWKPSLEDLLKIGFADYLAFKTYHPSDLLRITQTQFTLSFFSCLYLIDFIGRGGKELNITQTTAYTFLHFTCSYKASCRDDKFARRKVDLTSDSALLQHRFTPDEILLAQEPETTFRFKDNSKTHQFSIQEEYVSYQINPINFIPYLNKAYIDLKEVDRTNDFSMFHLIYTNALKQYVNDYRKSNFFLSQQQVEEMVNSLCILHGVDIQQVANQFTLPKRMYLKDFHALLITIKALSNTKYDIN